MKDKIFWRIKLENDIFARKHIIHIILLSSIEILIHLLLSSYINENIMSYYPITQIITLLVYQNTHTATKKQTKVILLTSFIGVIIAMIVANYLRVLPLTLPISFLALIIMLYLLKQPFYVITAGIIIIVAYFAQMSWWWYLILFSDIVFFSTIAYFLSSRFNVTSFDDFQESYKKLRYDFDGLATIILQFETTETGYYFQRILRLEDIIKRIKKERCVSEATINLLEQLLQEVYETYFYLRALNGKKDRSDIYEYHFQKMSQHYKNWIDLEAALIEKEVVL